jgi:hypothetical protein
MSYSMVSKSVHDVAIPCYVSLLRFIVFVTRIPGSLWRTRCATFAPSLWAFALQGRGCISVILIIIYISWRISIHFLVQVCQSCIHPWFLYIYIYIYIYIVSQNPISSHPMTTLYSFSMSRID